MILDRTRFLIAEQGLAELGKQISLVALPIVAVVDLNFGPGLVATMSSITGIAAIIGASGNAWLSQHVSLRTLIILATAISMMCLSAIPILWMTALLNANLLIVAAAGTSLVGSVYRVGVISLVPKLVPPEQCIRFNARINLVQSVVAIVCPLFVGAVAMAISPVYFVSFNALTWLLSGIVLVRIAIGVNADDNSMAPEAKVKCDVPLGKLFKNREVFFGLVSEGALTLCRSAAMTVLVLHILTVLKSTEFTVGVVLAVGGAGFGVGAALTSFAGKSMTYRHMIQLTSLLAIVCAVGLLASAAGDFPGVVGMCVFAGASAVGALLISVALTSWRQTNLDERQLGLVASVADGLGTGIRLIGAVVAGIVGEIFGVLTVVLSVGIAYLGVAVILPLLARK